jgi:amino-acid N-acetyltransferase
VIVRPPCLEDHAKVKSMLANAGLPVEDFAPEYLVFVADSEGEPVGAIGLEHFGNCGLLRSLIVAAASRGGGLGRKLVGALERHAKGLGETELWLLTIDADPYFGNLGYVERDRADAPDTIRGTTEFSALCPGDAVLMSKVL